MNTRLTISVRWRGCLIRTMLLFALGLLHGCATLEGPENPDDPFESYNRGMFAFNEAADRYVIKPVAEGYNAVMPETLSAGVTNFFSNIDDIVVLVNELFQLKFEAAIKTSGRLVYNTVFGLFGLVDVASDWGLRKQNEDFGQTLAYWGVPAGPFVVLPLVGPSTVRDTAGLAVDWRYFDPVFNRQTLRQSLLTLSVKYIDLRAGLIAASNIIDETVPDKYAFIRDAWLLRREYLIYDGDPPDDEFSEEELFDDTL